jgi:hypothetical protein
MTVLQSKQKQQVNLGGETRHIFGGRVEYRECVDKAGYSSAGF